ncbi:MAG: S1 family peptidase [Deltaproteobacteria bacterium]|nr:S1 family peptidase [Deltaproteobacteria bacterium]
MAKSLPWLAPVALLLSGALACTAPLPLDQVGATSEAIVDGTPDFSNHPAVVMLYNARRRSRCTAIIIAPKAVLTAKHCVQGGGASADSPGSFRVYAGAGIGAFTAEYRVSEVLAAPGSWDIRAGDESDVAMVILSTPAIQAPMEVAFDGAGALTGQTITAVGFGQTPANPNNDIKQRTEKRVLEVYRNTIVVDPAVCQGDSGGPLIGPDGRIYGVASYIFDPSGRREPVCGTALGAYNGWSRNDIEQFIRDGIEQSGACAPDGEEVCDGADNDCDGEVDEVCVPLGESCTADDECVGGLCGDTSVGRVCTEECGTLSPEIGCAIGFYCAQTAGCDGLCVPRSMPTGGTALGNDADCTVDSDCASLFCSDPGDGRARCLIPCEGDTGGCISGEVCAALPGSCGGCVPADLVVGLRGAGEPCAADTDCRSAMCFADEGISYCSSACAADPDCGDAFHCRTGACVRGLRGDLGSGCVANEDCSPEAPICAARGDVSWCTATCTGSCEAAGFSCFDVGPTSVCAPDNGLVGEPCAVPADCISGLCVDAGAGPVCSEVCSRDRACAAGFECTRTADGVTNVCVAPARAPKDGGGCAVSPVGRRQGTLLGFALFGFAFLSALLRRRRL